MTAQLSSFPSQLQQLVLLGGGGLGPAWGPLDHVADGRYLWDGHYIAYPVNTRCFSRTVLRGPSQWSLSLSSSSPWPARLALVAARLLCRQNPPVLAAHIEADEDMVRLYYFAGAMNGSRCWYCRSGEDAGRIDNLPTLPAHLIAHPPEVALLLALWDVEEVRARAPRLVQ